MLSLVPDEPEWDATPSPEEHGVRGRQYPLELDGMLVAEMANGGEWLEWWR